jgi:transcriptional regulator with XRE-family HTH domain
MGIDKGPGKRRLYKILRKKQSAPLAQLARELEVSQPYLSYIFNGRKAPSSEFLKRLCYKLDIPYDDAVSALIADQVQRCKEYLMKKYSEVNT